MIDRSQYIIRPVLGANAIKRKGGKGKNGSITDEEKRLQRREGD